MTIWIYEPLKIHIRSGRGWVDKDGIQHPSTWASWTDDEKKAMGLVEYAKEAGADENLYYNSWDMYGKVTSTPKGVETVRQSELLKCNTQFASYIVRTDWGYIRKLDTGEAVPANDQAWRTLLRAKKDETESAIKGAADFDALKTVMEADGYMAWPQQISISVEVTGVSAAAATGEVTVEAVVSEGGG
jgi:hypothetical protein